MRKWDFMCNFAENYAPQWAMRVMKTILLVFLGGGLGSVMRYLMGLAASGWNSPGHIPVATLVCNVAGCLLIGLFNGLSARWGWQPETRLMLTVGLCGGLTTFSTLSNEGLALIQSGLWMTYLAYVGGSILLGLVAVYAGTILSQ